MKKIGIGICIGLLLAFGFYTFTQKQDVQRSMPQPQDQKVVTQATKASVQQQEPVSESVADDDPQPVDSGVLKMRMSTGISRDSRPTNMGYASAVQDQTNQ